MKSSSFFPVSIPLKEDLKLDFALPKSRLPNVLSPLFGILIPILMGILKQHRTNIEIKSSISNLRYRDLDPTTFILDVECSLDEIRQYLNELVQLQGRKKQQWNLAIYEDFVSDLNECRKMNRNNPNNLRFLSVLRSDTQHFLEEIKKEHDLKCCKGNDLANRYRLTGVSTRSPQQTITLSIPRCPLDL